MTLFLNIGHEIVPGRNQDFRVRVRDFSRISECCRRLRQSERAGNYVSEENGDVIVTGVFRSHNIVPDVHRYDIRRCQNRFTLFPHCIREVNPQHNRYNDRPATNDGTDTLVVVVESPHKDEYHNEDLSSPIAAAQGSTGCGIQNHLAEIVNLVADVADKVPGLRDEYRVIIANPIRWQTSLSSLHGKSPRYAPWKNLRNAVWDALWGIDAVRCDFLARLCNYNPSIVVNACTGGAEDNGFNADVDRFIRNNNVIPDVCRRPRTPHPSVWHQRRRRKIYPRRARRRDGSGA